MKKNIVRFSLILVLLLVAGGAFASGSSGTSGNPDEKMMEAVPEAPMMLEEGMEQAVFAGGCFWGVEAVYERLDGVVDVVSGYSGGEADSAHYNLVGSGKTGHAEAVNIVFDPEKVSYETLLDVFFSVAHDPTELNFQGPDHGSQYRSAVFYADENQKQITEDVIARLDAKGVYRDPIVTEVNSLDAFYPAEPYHQNFMARNPNHPYIVYWDQPKISQLEKTYPELLAGR